MFNKPVQVFCKNIDELSNMLEWLRSNAGLVYMNAETWPVSAALPGILNEDQSVRGFWVEVPYSLAKPRLKKFQVQDAFSDVLSRP